MPQFVHLACSDILVLIDVTITWILCSGSIVPVVRLQSFKSDPRSKTSRCEVAPYILTYEIQARETNTLSFSYHVYTAVSFSPSAYATRATPLSATAAMHEACAAFASVKSPMLHIDSQRYAHRFLYQAESPRHNPAVDSCRKLVHRPLKVDHLSVSPHVAALA